MEQKYVVTFSKKVDYDVAYVYIWLTIVRSLLIGIDRYKKAR